MTEPELPQNFAEPLMHLAMRVPAVAIMAYHVGEGFTRYRLPCISGYLATGLITGPYVLGLVSEAALAAVRGPLDQVCLACIALAAGSELHMVELRRTFSNVSYITIGISAATWLFVTAVLMILANQIDFMREMGTVQRMCVASTGGTVMVARSPATAIAVLKEVEGRGPFCSLTLSVVVMKDVLVIVLFALNLSAVKFAQKGISNELESLEVQVLKAVLHPIVAVACSVVLGLAVGACLMLCLRTRAHKNVSAALEQRVKAAALFLLAVTCYMVATLFGGEALLACVAMGLYAANSSRDSHRLQADRDVVEGCLNCIMPGVNVAFFSLAGAGLQLDALASTVHIAVVVFVVRLLALYVGATVGSHLACCPADQVRVSWMAYVTQAGVALGLIKMVVLHEPTWGPPFSALMIGVVMLNLLVGPPMFKYAIISVGEDHKGVAGPAKHASDTKLGEHARSNSIGATP